MQMKQDSLACVTLHYILVSKGVIRKAKHLHPRKLTSTQFAGDGSACAHFFLDLEGLVKKNYLRVKNLTVSFQQCKGDANEEYLTSK